MHLVLCPDDAYAEHAAVTLASVFANSARPELLCVWIVSRGLGSRYRRLLERVVRRGGGRITVVEIDTARVRGAPCGEHISLASYYRLLAPGSLPDEVDRFLYLDSDVVVEADLLPLVEIDLGGNVLAAVFNPCARHGQLGLPEGTPYFNAGVLLVDRRRWEAERVTERVLAVIAERPTALRYWDQDALNIVLAGHWTALEPCWNQQHHFPALKPESLGYEPEVWRRALERPAIIHFTSGSKPWNARNRHPFRSRYRHYRRRVGLPPLWLRPSHLAEALRRLGLMPKRTEA